MLFATVHHPSIYEPDFFKEESYGKILHHICGDAVYNCIVLLDSQNFVWNDLSSKLNKIPIKYRKYLEEAFRTLKKRNRLVRCNNLQTEGVYGLSSKVLDLCCQLRDENNADVAFFSDKALDILRNHSLNKDSDITPLDYLNSEFEEHRREMTKAIDIDRWNKDEIERRVFEPILRFARWVRVFDKQIGRGTNLSRFHRGLRWLADFWLRAGVFTREPKVYFEIVTCLDTGYGSHEDPVGEVRSKIIQPMAKRFPFVVKCLFKEPPEGERFRHARYLQTNQACFLVEQGFDLLEDDGNVKGCEVGLKPDARQVISKFEALPDYALIDGNGVAFDWEGKKCF